MYSFLEAVKLTDSIPLIPFEKACLSALFMPSSNKAPSVVAIVGVSTVESA